MNNAIRTILTLATALATIPAAAGNEDFYLGAGIGSKGHMNMNTGAGRVGNTNDPRPLSIFGGYHLNDHFALESGYNNFGNYKFGGAGEIDLNALYLAAKGTIRISDAWTVFGKVGAARHSVEVSPAGLASRDTTSTTPIYGVGFGYKLTRKLTLEAEVMDYGHVRTQGLNLNYRQVRLGANFRF